MSIKESIIHYLEENGPSWGGKLEDDLRSLTGAKASNVSRRCRELVEAGTIERCYAFPPGVSRMCVRYRMKKVESTKPSISISHTVTGKVIASHVIIEYKRHLPVLLDNQEREVRIKKPGDQLNLI